MIAKNKKAVIGLLLAGISLNAVGAYALAASLGYAPVPDALRKAGEIDARAAVTDFFGARARPDAAPDIPSDPPVPAHAGKDDAIGTIGASDQVPADTELVTDITDPERTETVVPGESYPLTFHIPTAQPRPREIRTFEQELTGEVTADPEQKAVVADYVLGEDGVSDDMRRAWAVLERANRDNGDPGQAQDPQVFARAAGEIGYVPTGGDPKNIRRLGSEIGAYGHEVVLGSFEALTADTGIVDGLLVRLQGIRSPSAADTCETAAGKSYDCGDWAVNGLSTILSGRDLECEVSDETFGVEEARIGWCNIRMRNGNIRDVGEIAIEAGLVSAADTGSMISPYLRAEQKSRDAKNGIWSGNFRASEE